jgi:hypothetical protein
MSVGRPKKRKFAVAVTINDDSLEPVPELSNVIKSKNRQPRPSVMTTPIRAAKAKAIANLSEVINIQKRVKNEKEEQRYGELEEMKNDN